MRREPGGGQAVCICPQPIFFWACLWLYAQGPLVVKIIQNFEQPVLMEGFVFTAVEYWLLTSLCCKCSTSVWPKVRSSNLFLFWQKSFCLSNLVLNCLSSKNVLQPADHSWISLQHFYATNVFMKWPFLDGRLVIYISYRMFMKLKNGINFIFYKQLINVNITVEMNTST